MPDFKVIKNPDGTFTTAPADALPDVQKARQSVRDMLNGGGWFQDPNAAPVPLPEAPAPAVPPRPGPPWALGVNDDSEPLPKFDPDRCRCSWPTVMPPCSYCESGEYEV